MIIFRHNQAHIPKSSKLIVVTDLSICQELDCKIQLLEQSGKQSRSSRDG